MILFTFVKDKFKTSLWLIPALMGLFAISIPVMISIVETNYGPLLSSDWIKTANANTLGITLSTLLAAIVTVFGFLIPITFSILLKTSNQFTPRILRIYKQTYTPKLLIGLILSSVLYIMTLLMGLNYLFIFRISPTMIAIAFALIILSIYLIPVFFDRLATSIEPTFVLREISHNVQKIIKHQNEDTSNHRRALKSPKYKHALLAEKSGYLTLIDTKKFLDLASLHHITAVIPIQVGQYILANNPILFYQSKKKLNKETTAEILDCFAISENRMGINDIALKIEEILGILLHALSSGCTDLSTTKECINHLGNICNQLMETPIHPKAYRDAAGKIRLYTKEPDFKTIVHLTFDSVRQNAMSQPAVILHTLKTFEKLLINCKSNKYKTQIKMIAKQFVDQLIDTPSSCDIQMLKSQLKRLKA